MTQYDDRVQYQRDLLKAEKWAKTIKSLHAHSLNSMWYDNRPQDTEDGKSVMDIQYNSGLIERRTHDGYTVYFGKELSGEELVYEYHRHV
tara:strand:- start:58 stop:327 length:270 start_codon:yes stop_codon:yes gene_type:complete